MSEVVKYNYGMVQVTDSPLATYVQSVMDERHLSIRAFATYAGIAHSTVRRILAGEDVDHQTLIKIADYLKVPIENVYRLAGYLPEEEAKAQAIREIEHLMRMLPEESQHKILEIVRLEHKYHAERAQAEPEELRKVS